MDRESLSLQCRSPAIQRVILNPLCRNGKAPGTPLWLLTDWGLPGKSVASASRLRYILKGLQLEAVSYLPSLRLEGKLLPEERDLRALPLGSIRRCILLRSRMSSSRSQQAR